MTPREKSAGVPGRQKQRTGCLGCLWRVGVGLFLALVFAAAVTAFYIRGLFTSGDNSTFLRIGKAGEDYTRRAVTMYCLFGLSQRHAAADCTLGRI